GKGGHRRAQLDRQNIVLTGKISRKIADVAPIPLGAKGRQSILFFQKFREQVFGKIKGFACRDFRKHFRVRSEEHTSELQSRFDLVCRLLLEKKKKRTITY